MLDNGAGGEDPGFWASVEGVDDEGLSFFLYSVESSSENERLGGIVTVG